MRPMLATLLDDRAAMRPHDPALIVAGRTISYAELETVLERSGARMLVLQHGFRKIDFPVVLAGAQLSAFRAIDCVAVVDADAIAPSSIAGKPVVAFDAFHRACPQPDECADPNAVAAMFTTSGTTSGPKLVMHTQHTIAFHARHVAGAVGLTEPGARLLGGFLVSPDEIEIHHGGRGGNGGKARIKCALNRLCRASMEVTAIECGSQLEPEFAVPPSPPRPPVRQAKPDCSNDLKGGHPTNCPFGR